MVDTLVNILSAEEQSVGITQPTGIGQRPKPIPTEALCTSPGQSHLIPLYGTKLIVPIETITAVLSELVTTSDQFSLHHSLRSGLEIVPGAKSLTFLFVQDLQSLGPFRAPFQRCHCLQWPRREARTGAELCPLAVATPAMVGRLNW